jgi:hypothetical protein
MRNRIAGFVTAAALIAVSVVPGHAQVNNQVGTLVCNYGETIGMIVGSRQRMACIFHKSNGDTEGYGGTMSRVGLDLGVTGRGRMAWTVFTKTVGVGPRPLAGSYVGASGDASFGIGGGGNILVGGSNRTITLQPVSLEAQTGINFGLGVADLRLR